MHDVFGKRLQQNLTSCYGALVSIKIYRGVTLRPLIKDDFSCHFVPQSSKRCSCRSSYNIILSFDWLKFAQAL